MIDLRNLVTAGLLLIATAALAAPPPNADQSLAPWFHSLHMPRTNASCCDMADCRNYPVRPDGEHYQVLFENRWIIVPNEVVSDRTDNPTGDHVACIQRDHWTNGNPDGPIVLCFFKAPGT